MSGDLARRLPDEQSTVGDAAIALVRAAKTLDHYRAEADRIVADLEERWAANRTARNVHACTDGEPIEADQSVTVIPAAPTCPPYGMKPLVQPAA